MNETIRLMKSHFLFAVLRKKPSKKLTSREILSAGQMASSWKNFQSYSVIVVKARERKKLFTTFFLKKRFANQPSFSSLLGI